MAFRDLREFLAKLEGMGELKRLTRRVDWNLEIGAVMRKVFDQRGPAVLFESVKDSRYPLVAGVMDTYRRYALGIGAEEGLRAIFRKVLDAMEYPVAPVLVRDAPCHEHVDTGRAINVLKFPVPKWHEADGGRFIGTLGVVVLKDPDTGVRNMGIYREQVFSRNTIGILTTQQAGILVQKYWAKKKPVPVATAIGVDPCVLAASTVHAVAGQDELGIAGALRGAPVELVKCRTVDLEVPAHAEVVLEGVIPYDRSRWKVEGPFGEFTGYFGGTVAPKPTIHLTAVTYRDRPILQGTFEGMPPNESTTLRTVGHSIGAWNKVKRCGIPGFKELVMTEMGCANFMVVASMERQYYVGNARQVIEAIWATATNNAKWVIVVDDDIDIYDRGQVEWALSTRVQPYRDIIITANREPGIDLDPSIHPSERAYPAVHSSRIGIDATTQFKGYDFPPKAIPGEAIMRKVERQWPRYGL